MTKKDDKTVASKGGVSRRDMIAMSAGASFFAASVAADSYAAGPDKSKDKSKDIDVLIIGGGFCGVTAARELGLQGYNVTLLEARNRLGGRTFTTEFNGEMVDMGGTWVHWLQPHSWAEISRYGMELEETRGSVAEKVIYLDYEGKRHETKTTEIWPTYDDFERTVATFFDNKAFEIMPRPASPTADDRWIKEDIHSVKDKLDSYSLREIDKIFCDMLFTTYGGTTPDEISWVDMLRWYALSGYNATVMNEACARFKMKGGTKVLLDKIAADSGADIKLATPVHKVTQHKNYVEVLTDHDEVYRAKTVICAVPMNVLQNLEFSPALKKEKVEVSKQGGAAKATKTHILLDKEYPEFGGWAPGGDTPINFLLWDGVKDGKTHLISFGPGMDQMDMDDNDAVETAVRQFLPDAKVVEAYGYGWGVDPYSNGLWGVSRVGQLSKYINHLQESQGNIHFANADWANGWRGFIDGAIEQGIMAARKVRDQIKP